MAWFVGSDRLGNAISFNTDDGTVIPLPPADDPPPPPPPPPPPGGTAGRTGLGAAPAAIVAPGGGCFTTMADVYRWFVQYLGGPPQSDAEAQGYGRVGLPCDQVIAEIASSQEAANYRASGKPDPARVIAAPKPGTVAPIGGACPIGQHKLFGVGPCVPDTIGPELPPELTSVLQEILAELGTIAHDSTKDIHAIADDVVAAFDGKLGPLANDLTKITDSLKSQLGGLVGTLPKEVAQLIGAGLSGAEGIISAFLANAATVEDVAGAAVKAVKGEKGGLFEFLLGLVMTGGSGIAAQTLAALQAPPPATPGRPAVSVPTEGGIAAELDVPYQQLTDPRDPLAAAGSALELALGFLGGLLAFLEPGSEQVRQYAWSLSPNKLVDSGAAVSAEVRGFITPGAAEEISARQGLNGWMHAIERELARARPGTGELLDAWHRDEINTEQLLRGLARLGYDNEARGTLIAIARRLLGPDALARLSDRGLATIGGDPTFAGVHEMTTEFVREGLNAGLSNDDIERQWNLHYIPPDVGQAAELLHLGTITVENYRAALKANGVPPEWRPAYEAAVFIPFGRRDWLRLVQHGLIDHAGLVRSIMDNGYSPERAEIVAQLIEKVAADTKKAAKDPQRGPLTAQHLALYEDGARSRADTEAALATLEHAPDEIVALISEADMRREVKRIAEVVRLVRPLYVQDIWDWPRAATELTAWGIDADHQAELKREWDLSRALADQKPHQAKAHELTVAELTAAFIEGDIHEDAFRARLSALRFNDQDVELEVVLAKTKQHKALQADQIAQTEHALLNGTIDEQVASDALDQIGVPPGKRDRLLDGWLKTHASRRVELTTAQLTALLSGEIINEDELHDYMLRLPYGDQERLWLEALIGSKAAAAQARTAAAAAKAAKAAAAAAKLVVP